VVPKPIYYILWIDPRGTKPLVHKHQHNPVQIQSEEGRRKKKKRDDEVCPFIIIIDIELVMKMTKKKTTKKARIHGILYLIFNEN
jgi:hypothetical protein